jgi:hypothetical protein
MKELERFSLSIAWLGAEEAAEAYEHVRKYDAKTRYGLDDKTVRHIERLEFGDNAAAARAWLTKKLRTEYQLVVVFGKNECFECSPFFFLNNWPEIFAPGRDDAIAYAKDGEQILFLSHENELEIGVRVECLPPQR